MVRFRSFPSRPFYSFSSAIKNLFEARDFLLSRDRRRNAPSLIPILNQRNSRTLPRLERRFFLVPLQRATLHRPMDSSFSQSNRESRAWNRDKMEFFFFSNSLFCEESNCLRLIISCFRIIAKVSTRSKN